MIGFEQMPGRYFPILKKWHHFEVRHGKQRAAANDPRNFAEKKLRIFHVFEDFDADSVIKFAVETGKTRIRVLQFSMRKLAAFEQGDVVIRFARDQAICVPLVQEMEMD